MKGGRHYASMKSGIRGMQCCYRLRNCMRAEHNKGATLSPAAAQAATVLACALRVLPSCSKVGATQYVPT
jgi:hypothetical protein